jgi:hypothetical protein
MGDTRSLLSLLDGSLLVVMVKEYPLPRPETGEQRANYDYTRQSPGKRTATKLSPPLTSSFDDRVSNLGIEYHHPRSPTTIRGRFS